MCMKSCKKKQLNQKEKSTLKTQSYLYKVHLVVRIHPRIWRISRVHRPYTHHMNDHILYFIAPK